MSGRRRRNRALGEKLMVAHLVEPKSNVNKYPLPDFSSAISI
jgi:hypothetical protein